MFHFSFTHSTQLTCLDHFINLVFDSLLWLPVLKLHTSVFQFQLSNWSFSAISMFLFHLLFQTSLLQTVHTIFCPSTFLSFHSFKSPEFAIVYSIIIFQSFRSSCICSKWLYKILTIPSSAIFFHPNASFTTYQTSPSHLFNHVIPIYITFRDVVHCASSWPFRFLCLSSSALQYSVSGSLLHILALTLPKYSLPWFYFFHVI